MSFPGLVEVESNVQGTTRIVAVRGEVDLSSVDRLQRAIDDALAARPETILLDLSQVEFCDSSGINLVVTSHRRATQSDVRFVVVRPDGPAWRPFELCNIDRHVTFIGDGDGHNGRPNRNGKSGNDDRRAQLS